MTGNCSSPPPRRLCPPASSDRVRRSFYNQTPPRSPLRITPEQLATYNSIGLPNISKLIRRKISFCNQQRLNSKDSDLPLPVVVPCPTLWCMLHGCGKVINTRKAKDSHGSTWPATLIDICTDNRHIASVISCPVRLVSECVGILCVFCCRKLS